MSFVRYQGYQKRSEVMEMNMYLNMKNVQKTDVEKHKKTIRKIEKEGGKKVKSSKDDDVGTTIPPRYFDAGKS